MPVRLTPSAGGVGTFQQALTQSKQHTRPRQSPLDLVARAICKRECRILLPARLETDRTGESPLVKPRRDRHYATKIARHAIWTRESKRLGTTRSSSA